VSDADRLNGRRLLLAEELALIAIDRRDGAFPATPALEAAYGAALLGELRAREVVRFDGDDIRVIDGWPTGDAVLDEVVLELRDGSALSIQRRLDRMARSGLVSTIVDRLERSGIVAHRRDVVLGLIPATRWLVVPPRIRTHWEIRLHAIVRGADLPDTREAALLPLLAATRILSGYFERAERPAAYRLAQRLGRGDPLVGSLDTVIARSEAMDAAASVAVMS
jgi:hypothetical protein